MQIQRCNDTGKFFFYPRGLSPFTLSGNIAWEPVSGKGVVHAFTIVHAYRAPGFGDELPYVVALIELDEGVRLVSNLREIAPDGVEVGMPVEVFYETFDSALDDSARDDTAREKQDLVLHQFRPTH